MKVKHKRIQPVVRGASCLFALAALGAVVLWIPPGHDSVKDRATIIYVLGAFIRERSKATRDREDDPPEDVKAGIRVVGAGALGLIIDALLDRREDR